MADTSADVVHLFMQSFVCCRAAFMALVVAGSGEISPEPAAEDLAASVSQLVRASVHNSGCSVGLAWFIPTSNASLEELPRAPAVVIRRVAGRECDSRCLKSCAAMF